MQQSSFDPDQMYGDVVVASAVSQVGEDKELLPRSPLHVARESPLTLQGTPGDWVAQNLPDIGVGNVAKTRYPSWRGRLI